MNNKWFAACIMAAAAGCSSSSTLAPAFEPPPLPDEVVTSGITFRAAVKVVKSDPTTVRVTVDHELGRYCSEQHLTLSEG